MAVLLSKLRLQKKVSLTRTSFAEATTDITPKIKGITAQETTADTALENSEIIQDAENFKHGAESNHAEKQLQNNSSLMIYDEHHQSLLKKSILCREIAGRILSYVGERDLRNTSRFVFSFSCLFSNKKNINYTFVVNPN